MNLLSRPLAVYSIAIGGGLVLMSGWAAAWLGTRSDLAFAALWLYLPLLAIRADGGDWKSHGLTWAQLPGSWRYLLLALFILLPYSLLVQAWLHWTGGGTILLALPEGFALLVLNQLILVALPEEVFFRGYLQTRFDQGGWSRQLFGLRLTWANVSVSALFALAHLVLHGDPRALAVFFPSLLFGLLRQESGSVVQPIFYHALCNLFRVFILG